MNTVLLSSIPQGFLLGAAWWAYAVEGNSVQSDLWAQEQLVMPSAGNLPVYPEWSGDGIDHYHRWREDLALLAQLGLRTVRFSLSWSRIEPAPGRTSQAELTRYREMLQQCHALNLSPIVVLHQLDSPQWLMAEGGWQGAGVKHHFVRYCVNAMQALGDLTPQVVPMFALNAHEQLRQLSVVERLPGASLPAGAVPYWQATHLDRVRVYEAAAQAIRWTRPMAQVGTSWVMPRTAQQTPPTPEWAAALAHADFACVESYGACDDASAPTVPAMALDRRQRWLWVEHEPSEAPPPLSALVEHGWPLCGWLNAGALPRWDGKRGWRQGQWIEVNRGEGQRRTLAKLAQHAMKQGGSGTQAMTAMPRRPGNEGSSRTS